MTTDSLPTNEPGAEPALGLRLRDIACANLRSAAKLLKRPGDALNSGIHQGRKALRRARAVMALAGGKLKPSAVSLDGEIRSLARGLSALRDAHALVETLERLRGDCSDPALEHVLPGAIAAASARRDRMLKASLERDPAMQSRRDRLARMRARLALLSWTEVGEKTVRKALRRSVRRIKRAEKHALAHPDDNESWHTLRRRIRRLRQQHSVLQKLAPHLLEHLPTSDPRADQLSESQDDALLLARCGSHSPFDPTQRAVLRKVARARLARVRL